MQYAVSSSGVFCAGPNKARFMVIHLTPNCGSGMLKGAISYKMGYSGLSVKPGFVRVMPTGDNPSFSI